MATNKVVYNGKTLIDLSSDTVAASTLVEGITAHNKAGNIITGTVVDSGRGDYIWKKYYGKVWNITTTDLGKTKPSDCIGFSYNKDYAICDDGYFIIIKSDFVGINGYSYIIGKGEGTKPTSIYYEKYHFVLNGNSYNTYSLITVGNTYSEGKGGFIGYVTSESPSTYPDDGLKNGYYYVKVNTSSSSSGSSNNNCEAYLVDVTNPTVSFKTTSGTIKAYGYAYETTKSQWGGQSTTVYAFNGTNYYKSAAYGSPTATNITLGISGGKLTGLPNLTSGTLLVTKGI